MVIKSIKYHGFISIIPTNYLILGYEPKEGSEIGNVKVALGMTRFAPAKEKVFALRSTGNNYEIDYFGIIDAFKRFKIKPLKLNKR